MRAKSTLRVLFSLLSVLAGLSAAAQEAAWTAAPGLVSDVAIGGDGSVWAIGTEPAGARDKQIFRSTPDGWKVVPGAAARVAVGPKGRAFVVSVSGKIFRWEEGWKPLPGAAVDVAVGPDGTLHAVGKAGEVFRLAGATWSKVAGSEGLKHVGGAQAIAVGPDGTIWVVTGNGEIHRHGPPDRSWRRVPGQARDVAVGHDGTVFVVGSEAAPGGFGVLRLAEDRFVPESGAAGVRVAAGPRGMAYVVQEPGSLLARGAPASPTVLGIQRPEEPKPVSPSPAPVGTAIAAPPVGTPPPPPPIVHEASTVYIPPPPPAPQPTGISVAVPSALPTRPTQAPPLERPESTPISAPTTAARLPITFVPLPGRASDVAMGTDGSMWALGAERGPGGSGIFRYQSGTWHQVAGAAVRIAVDPKGVAWVLNEAGMVHRWNGTAWDLMPGRGIDIGIGGDGTVWVLGSDDAAYKWTGSDWTSVGGGAKSIAVGPDGNPWVVNAGGEIWRHDGQTWHLVSGDAVGGAVDVAVDAAGTVFVLGGAKVSGGRAVYRRAGDSWVVEPKGAGVRIGAGPADRLLIAQEGEGGGPVLGTLPPGMVTVPVNLGVMPIQQTAPPVPVNAPVNVVPPASTSSTPWIPSGAVVMNVPINTTTTGNVPSAPSAGGSTTGGTLQASGSATTVIVPSAGTAPLVVGGQYGIQIVPGAMACSDGGNVNSAPCGYVRALDLGAFTPKAPHECPSGSFYDAYFGGSCWSCGDWRRTTDEPIDTDAACDGKVYVRANYIRQQTFAWDCPTASFWDGYNRGACYTCPAGYERSAEHIATDWGCFRVAEKPATFMKNLGCAEQTSWKIGDPKPFPDLGLGTCYACPVLDAETGEVLVTQRSIHAADGDRACRVQFRWKPAQVKPLRIAHSEGAGVLPGAGELMAEILEDHTRISGYFRAEAQEAGVPADQLPALLERRWQELATAPNESEVLKSLLLDRVVLALQFEEGMRSPAEQRLLQAFTDQALARNVSIPQDALDMYRAWKASVDAARQNRALSRLDHMMYYGTVPPDFSVAAQATAALGTVGLGTVAFSSSVAVYRHNLRAMDIRDAVAEATKRVRIAEKGLAEAEAAFQAGKGTPQAVVRARDTATTANRFMAQVDDAARAGRALHKATEVGSRHTRLVSQFADATSAIRGAVRAGRFSGQAARVAVRSALAGARSAIIGASMAAMAANLILVVGSVFVEIAIDQVVEIATAEPELVAKVEAARTPVDLAALLQEDDGLSQITYHWASMLDVTTGQPDVRLAGVATQAWAAARASGYAGPRDCRSGLGLRRRALASSGGAARAAGRSESGRTSLPEGSRIDRVMRIRPATADDDDAIWSLFQDVVREGDAFAFSEDTSREEALALWRGRGSAAYVAVVGGEILGSYYVKPNQPGRGAHVCNAGYMVARAARGHGVGRAMGEHSLAEARRLGYRAMQYNFVVATNTGAVELWKKLGFEVVGRVPGAFRHAREGLVDALVMYRPL